MNRSILPRLAAVGAVTALTVSLAACGDDPEPAAETTTVTQGAGDGTAATTAAPASTPPPGSADGVLTVRIGWRDAVQRAQREFDGGLAELDLDDDDGRYSYEVTLVDGPQERSFDIDAETGETTGRDSDDEDDAAPTVDLNDVVDPADAMKTALGRTRGRVVDWKLDRSDDRGRFEYEIHIDTGTDDDQEVTVDAHDGTLVGVDG